jgi:hypothetical protein
MSSQPDADLGGVLHQRRGEASLVSRAPHPAAKTSECHANVAAYIRSYPGCQPVRGWLIEQFDGFAYFNAHSIVRLENGSLIDITPLDCDCPFIIHQGTEEEFERLTRNCPRVQYPPAEFGEDFLSAPVEDEDGECIE